MEIDRQTIPVMRLARNGHTKQSTSFDRVRVRLQLRVGNRFMSRIGNKPVPIVDGVKVTVSGGAINVEGPKGKLSYELRPEVEVAVEESEVKVTRRSDNKSARAFHGLTRALVANMIVGVKDGYEKKLELQGVGYVCSIKRPHRHEGCILAGRNLYPRQGHDAGERRYPRCGIQRHAVLRRRNGIVRRS